MLVVSKDERELSKERYISALLRYITFVLRLMSGKERIYKR